MSKVPFDDSARCHGASSRTTGSLFPICICCSRLTSKRNTATVKGQVYRDTMGSSDCKDWKPHAFNVRLHSGAGNPYAVGGAK